MLLPGWHRHIVELVGGDLRKHSPLTGMLLPPGWFCVGAGEQHRRNFETESLRSGEVDRQLELCRQPLPKGSLPSSGCGIGDDDATPRKGAQRSSPSCVPFPSWGVRTRGRALVATQGALAAPLQRMRGIFTTAVKRLPSSLRPQPLCGNERSKTLAQYCS
jgi:hypothetical protein